MKISFVEGEENNFKITHKEDLIRAKMFIENSVTKVGLGFDVHAFSREKSNGIKICGVKIPFRKKLEGHSDADVGLHAIVDALLGAIAKGDIGKHFPPSDKKWKNADSSVFVKYTKDLIEKENGKINNIDVTLICEEPKISPHREKMIANVARLLSIDKSKISVKATTTEGLGFTGRKEGIAAQAIASVLINREDK